MKKLLTALILTGAMAHAQQVNYPPLVSSYADDDTFKMTPVEDYHACHAVYKAALEALDAKSQQVLFSRAKNRMREWNRLTNLEIQYREDYGSIQFLPEYKKHCTPEVLAQVQANTPR